MPRQTGERQPSRTGAMRAHRAGTAPAPVPGRSGAGPHGGTMVAVQISADRDTPAVRLAAAAAARGRLFPGEA